MNKSKLKKEKSLKTEKKLNKLFPIHKYRRYRRGVINEIVKNFSRYRKLHDNSNEKWKWEKTLYKPL